MRTGSPAPAERVNMATKRYSLSSSRAGISIKRIQLVCAFAACSGMAAQAQIPAGAIPNPLQGGQRTGGISAQPTAISITPEGLQNLKLAPGNLITLHVFEEPDLDGAYRIDGQGNVSIPVIGSVQVGSLSLREAEAAIDAKLISGEILTNPHVTVNISDYGSQSVVILGEVNAPGRLTIVGPHKLQDVLAMAGGTTVYSGDQIQIQRAGQSTDKSTVIPFNRSLGSSPNLDTLVNPGDSVIVKRAGTVYVLGAVTHPGGYVMQESGTLNVLEALALASGTVAEASITNVRILRKGADESWNFVPVPLNKIQKGRANATPLQAGDVVYVPPSTVKEVAITARQLLAGVAGATIYLLR